MTHPFPTRRSSDLFAVAGDDALDLGIGHHHMADDGVGKAGAVGDRLQPLRLADRVGRVVVGLDVDRFDDRSEEHTSELQSLMRNSYAVFCLTKKTSHTMTHCAYIL